MLIWLGVVGTVLALIGVAGVAAIVWAVRRFEHMAEFLDAGQDSFLEVQKKRMEHEDQWLKEFSGVFSESSKTFKVEIDRAIVDWKQAATAFTKSEQELADNLAALLREVKVSKAFALGSTALVEQNVAAVDKLWQMVEMLRRGPRVATNLAPSDAEIAAREKGESSEQQVAIDGMLAAARDRLMHPDDLQ